jgi:hypothetical protein
VKVGDRVAVVESKSAMFGRIGSVSGFKNGNVRVELDDTNSSLDCRLLFAKSELRLVIGAA